MANFQPTTAIQYEGEGVLLKPDGSVLYDTAQGVRIWGNATQDNYSIGDTTTGGVDSTYGSRNIAIGAFSLATPGTNKFDNIAIGSSTLSLATKSGDPLVEVGIKENIAIGKNTIKGANYVFNTIAIGNYILDSFNTNASTIQNAVLIGANISKLTTSAISHNYNVIIGSNILGGMTTGTVGQHNVLIGGGVAGAVTSVGDFNIIIGNNSAAIGSVGNNNISIGYGMPAQSGTNDISIMTNGATTGIQFTNSTGVLLLKADKVNAQKGLTVGSPTLTSSSASIYIPGTISGAATAYAVFDNAEIQTDVTATAYNYYSQPKIVASHPGLTRLDHFSAYPASFNGATVTNQYGFVASSSLAEAVGNTGFYGNISGNSKTIDTMSQAGTTVTAVTSIAHTLKVGSVISVYGCSDPLFDISRAIVTGISTTVVANDTITFTSPLTRTVGSTSVSGTLYDLSDLNLEMYGTAPNVINGYLLVGRGSAYLDSMQVTQTPGSTQIVANNQFTGGIASTNNSTNLSYGSSISLLKNYSATVTDMTAAPTNMNIGHIYWGTTDGRKYINAASILVRTTAATNLADTAGGGATTNMIFNVANNAMPSEVGRFTPLGLQVLATQINTGTKANTAWLASGTADSTTFLRGDGTWATTSGAASTQSIARTFALMGA